MRKWLFAACLLIPAVVLAKPRHPLPTTPDQIWQNDLDLSNQIENFTSGDIVCIDSPTFCVNASSNYVRIIGNLSINPTNKFFVDGGSDTYITEISANRMQFFVGGILRLDLNGGSALVSVPASTDLSIPSGQLLYLDGGSDTYISESSANQMSFRTGGIEALRITSGQTVSARNTGESDFFDLTGTSTGTVNIRMAPSGATANSARIRGTQNGTNTDLNFLTSATERFRINATGDIGIASGNKLFLDGVTLAGDTYLIESSGNTMNFYTGGAVVTTFTASGVSLLGTTTNDNANVGWIGEYGSSITAVAKNAATSTQQSDLVSVVLSSGDYDLYGVIYWTSNSATWTVAGIGISSTTGNSTAGLTLGDTRLQETFASSAVNRTTIAEALPQVRVSNAGSTTWYLKYSSTFSAGTPQAVGRLSWRRRR